MRYVLKVHGRDIYKHAKFPAIPMIRLYEYGQKPQIWPILLKSKCYQNQENERTITKI